MRPTFQGESKFTSYKRENILNLAMPHCASDDQGTTMVPVYQLAVQVGAKTKCIVMPTKVRTCSNSLATLVLRTVWYTSNTTNTQST